MRSRKRLARKRDGLHHPQRPSCPSTFVAKQEKGARETKGGRAHRVRSHGEKPASTRDTRGWKHTLIWIKAGTWERSIRHVRNTQRGKEGGDMNEARKRAKRGKKKGATEGDAASRSINRTRRDSPQAHVHAESLWAGGEGARHDAKKRGRTTGEEAGGGGCRVTAMTHPRRPALCRAPGAGETPGARESQIALPMEVGVCSRRTRSGKIPVRNDPTAFVPFFFCQPPSPQVVGPSLRGARSSWPVRVVRLGRREEEEIRCGGRG